MANKFGIPRNIEEKLRARDKNCVYCHKKMIYPYVSSRPSNSATIEHFREKGPFFWDEDLKKRSGNLLWKL